MLEQLFDLKSIKGSSINIVLLGIIYAFLGILSSFLLFPSYVSIMSLAFTAILLIPSIAYLLQKEENLIAKEYSFSARRIFADHKDIIRLYLLLFLGIFLAFLVIGSFSSVGYVENFFPAQIEVAGLSGKAVDYSAEFLSILSNNLMVLVICFILSLAYGAGSLLFLVWNASVWGIVMGYIIRQSAIQGGVMVNFVKLMMPFLPHMLTEAISYIVAAIVGGILAKGLLREKLGSQRFFHILKDGAVLAGAGFALVVISGILEVFVFPLFL